MSALTETFTVRQWGRTCGPPPVSRTLQPAGQATIVHDGQELVITSAGRTLRTDRCVDPMTTLAPTAHSIEGTAWRTRCATPQGDARRAFVNSAYFSTDENTIAVAETGRYEFTIDGGRCVADMARQASLSRVRVAPVASDVAPAAPSPSADTQHDAPSGAKADCSAPSEPERLEVRPSRKLLRLGDEFAFRAIVVDRNGCTTDTDIHWSVGAVRSNEGRKVRVEPSIDSHGKLSLAGFSASEAVFDVIATAAGRSAKASVEVTSAANYDALLAQSGLGPSGERGDPAVAILATASIGASRVLAEDTARQRKLLFVSIIGGLTFILAAVALLAWRRARQARIALENAARARHESKMREYERQKRAREELHAAQMQAHLESVAASQQAPSASRSTVSAVGAVFCPSCRREFAAAEGGYCPFDANVLVPVAGHEHLLAGPGGGVCPTCRRGYNPGVRVCPNDGDELVPAALISVRPQPARGKICPTCGDRFDGNAGFCGKDGTQLVLLN